MPDIPTLRLSGAAAASVAAGHPWVFREAAAGAVAVGALVRLTDGRGRAVGFGLADEGPIAVRVLGRGEPEVLGRLLVDRVGRADAVRMRLVPGETDAMRVVSAAGDGLPGLIVDRYGGIAVLRVYAAAWLPHLDEVVGAIRRLSWVASVLRRYGVARVDGRDGTELLWGPPVPDRVVVSEQGVRMIVRPHAGQKTGLFLDQRVHRALVGGWAAGRRVVNLFAYTGGFSVTAALGGAARVVTIDLAPDAIEDARENFVLNGLDPDQHGFDVADAFTWAPPGPVDLLIVDPPSLAHDKRSEGAARSAYRKLHRRLAAFVTRDGLLATSSCTARLPHASWVSAVEEGLCAAGDWSWHWTSNEPPDHPVTLGHREGRYLKFGLLRRR